MKLHAFDLLLAVSEPHDHTVARLGGDLQAGRQALAFNHQRMITAGFEDRVHVAKDRLPIMNNFRGFAMHDRGGAHHASAEGLTDSLVTQADAEDWNASGKARYQRECYSRVVRCPRSGRD
jgi:hypothetical protein